MRACISFTAEGSSRKGRIGYRERKIRRQVRARAVILLEKVREESKTIPRLRTVAERGKGRRGGAILGGHRNINSVLELLMRSLREEAQAVIELRTSDRNEA